MDTFLVNDFEKVCRICMKVDQTFLSITSFNIIDMITAFASVQIWENDDLPNQICQACFLQLQNINNFKELCENSEKTFRQIIQQNKINLSDIQNGFNDVKDEEFVDYTNDNPLLDFKVKDLHENVTNENISENMEIRNGPTVNECKKSITHMLNNIQISKKTEEGNDLCDRIKDNENEIETFNCENCLKEFKKAWALGKHMRREHRAKGLNCSKCNIKFYHLLHLKKHKELSHNPLNLTCNTCDKVFSNIYKLKNHKCKQLLSKLLQCQRCDKSFNSKRELKYHNKEEHSQIEQYMACHICGKSVSKRNLKKHLIIHEKRDKVTCSICSKTFLHQQNLKNHIKHVHENQKPERKHLCNVCGFASRRSADLRKHLRTHTTERPYACDHCDKTYRSSLNLKEHILCTHLNQRKFQCKFCPQAFNHKKTLVHHERRHTGEKPHKCEVCGKRFIQKIALQIHTKIHTNSKEKLRLIISDGIYNI